MSANSSGSVERFLLGVNENKTFETLAPGGNTLVIDVENFINQGIDGAMATGGNANVILGVDTSEDASSWTAVDCTPGVGGDTLTVVPGGKASATVKVGKFCRVTNTGTGLATFVVKPLHRIQVRGAL